MSRGLGCFAAVLTLDPETRGGLDARVKPQHDRLGTPGPKFERQTARYVVVGAAMAFASGAAASAMPDAGRQAELLHRLRHDCGSCHGMTLKGGLGPPLLPATLEGRTDEELARIVLDGVPRTPMPPWRVEITEGEALWLVGRLKEGLDAD